MFDHQKLYMVTYTIKETWYIFDSIFKEALAKIQLIMLTLK